MQSCELSTEMIIIHDYHPMIFFEDNSNLAHVRYFSRRVVRSCNNHSHESDFHCWFLRWESRSLFSIMSEKAAVENANTLKSLSIHFNIPSTHSRTFVRAANRMCKYSTLCHLLVWEWENTRQKDRPDRRVGLRGLVEKKYLCRDARLT